MAYYNSNNNIIKSFYQLILNYENCENRYVSPKNKKINDFQKYFMISQLFFDLGCGSYQIWTIALRNENFSFTHHWKILVDFSSTILFGKTFHKSN